MALIADFSSIQTDDLKNFIITDTSTVNYDGENILNRTIILTYVDGHSVTHDFPIVNGPGDQITIPVDEPDTEPIEKDISLTIEMILDPEYPDPTSVYEITKPAIIVGNVEKCILDRIKKSIMDSDPKNVLTLPQTKLDGLEKIKSFYEAALYLIPTGDLTGAQEALDLSEALCNSDCGCK